MHLTMLDLQRAFVEFRPLLGQCRFNDCRHRGEPGCAIDAAVARGKIDPRRIQCYRKVLAELERAKRHCQQTFHREGRQGTRRTARDIGRECPRGCPVSPGARL